MDGMELRAGSPSKRREATLPLRSCLGKPGGGLRTGFSSGLKSTPGFRRVFNLWEEVEEITGSLAPSDPTENYTVRRKQITGAQRLLRVQVNLVDVRHQRH